MVIDAGANDQLDVSSVEMLTQLVQTVRSAGIDFALADVRQPVLKIARRAGLLDQIGENRIFHTVDQAVQTLRLTSDQH